MTKTGMTNIPFITKIPLRVHSFLTLSMNYKFPSMLLHLSPQSSARQLHDIPYMSFSLFAIMDQALAPLTTWRKHGYLLTFEMPHPEQVLQKCIFTECRLQSGSIHIHQPSTDMLAQSVRSVVTDRLLLHCHLNLWREQGFLSGG